MPVIRYWRWLVAPISGVLMWSGFAPLSWGWSSFFAVCALIAVLVGTTWHRAFLYSTLSGFVFFALLLYWLTIVGLDAWLLLSLVCSLSFGVMGVGIALLSRFKWWPLLVPGMWIAQEWVRGSFPFGGFPWGSLAFSQIDTSFGRSAVVLGMLGSGGWLVLGASALVAGVRELYSLNIGRSGAWFGLVLVTFLAPLLIHPPTQGDTQGGAAAANIGIVQGGTPEIGLGAFDVRRAVLDNHVRQTMLLAIDISRDKQERPVFVLWPENSSDLDPYVDRAAQAAIGVAARTLGVPILVGAVVNNPADQNTVLNQGILWDPLTGAGQQYSKTHPVPFGEYIPFRSLLAPLINRFDRIGRDFAAGTQTGIFNIGGIAAGDVICFEVAYNSVIDPLIDDGARVLMVQTNNATYAGTAQPGQQFAIERMRALETGRSVVVAATTGISAFINPDGTVQAQIPEGQVGGLVREVALRGSLNLSAYLSRPISAAWALVAVVIAAWVPVRAVRRKRTLQRKVTR